jgi:hypothetical protein
MTKESRIPKNFEDCVAKLRYSEGKGDCADCEYKPKRGANWKKCGLRVKMFLREGGNII